MAGIGKRRWVTGVFILLVAAAVFLLLDFRLLRGQFNAEHQVSTFTFGNEGPQEIAQGQDVDLYMQGTNWITRGMVGSMIQALEANPRIGDVRLREGPPQPAGSPVLVVRVDEADLLWALVYGQARVKLHASYATNGAVDWMDDETVISVPGPYTKWISGDFTAQDRSFGLISLPGYASYLGQQFGARISEALSMALKE